MGILDGRLSRECFDCEQPFRRGAKEVAQVYRRLASHLLEGSLGGVAEVFDGYHGTISRGCHT
ncbi:MAG: hypothetical protein MZU97_23905 [Bacillus subtilis]|nr:hypothetical protein [Bacillus subtilis]